MATTFTLDELYGEPAQPVTKPASSGWRVSPEEQATRDEVRTRILQREAADPDLPGGAASRAAVGREIQRAGGQPLASVKQAKPAAEQTTFSLDELYGEPAKAKPESTSRTERYNFLKAQFGEAQAEADAQQTASQELEASRREKLGAPGRLGEDLGTVAKGTVKNFAALGDMLLGIPHQAMSMMANHNVRLAGLVQGKSHSEIAQEAEARVKDVLSGAPTPIGQLTAAIFDDGIPSDVDHAMEKVDGFFDKVGNKAQEATGGRVRREDVKTLVNDVFAIAGISGVRVAAKAKVTSLDRAAKAEGQPKALTNEQAAQQRASRQVEEAAEAQAVGEAQGRAVMEAGRLRAQEARAVAQREYAGTNSDALALQARSVERLRAQAKVREDALGEQRLVQTETKALKAKRNDVKAAFAEDPLWADYLRDRAETEALVREGRRAEAMRLQPEEMAPRTRPAERTMVDEQARTIETVLGLPPDQLRVTAPTPLTSGLAKVAKGRSFDLNAAELSAIKQSSSQWNRPNIQRGGVDVKALGEALDDLTGMSLDEVKAMARALPKGVEIKETPTGFEAFKDGKRVGYLNDNLKRGQAEQIGENANIDIVRVDKEVKGQGVGAALYRAFAEKHGGRVAPSGKTTADAWKVWRRDYPEKVEAFAEQEAARIKDGAPAEIVLGNITDPVVAQQVLSRARQAGNIDAELAKKLGAAGAGAAIGLYLADDNQFGAGLLGAGAGLVLAGKTGAAAVKGADYGLGLVATRVKNLSIRTQKRLRDYEGGLLRNAHLRITEADPFLQSLNKLKKSDQAAFNQALTSNSTGKLQSLLEKHPEIRAQWAAVERTIRETGQTLVKAGVLQHLRQDYLFPRVVIDRPGLLAKLKLPVREGLERLLHEAELKAAKTTGEKLSAAEESKIINQYLQGRTGGSAGPGLAKQRVIQEVTPELLEFYANPAEALHTYLAEATRAIEKAKLFGKDLVKTADGRVDTNKSIGELVQREWEAGKITSEGAKELRSMLESRFGAGERGANPILQHVRNLSNAGLLGNVVSAASQAGDALMAVAAQDMRSVAQAVAQKLSGRQRVSAKDFGLVDHLAEESVGTNWSAKFLNRWLKVNLFTAVDLFGKDINLNSALIRHERLVKTVKGEKELARKYKEAYADDYPQLVEDLKAKKLTDNTRSLLFNELSDMQPVSKLEFPQMYLDLPNGRFIYTLKSYMLKQLDVVRRNVYDEYRKGSKTRAMVNLVKLGLALGVAGATTDIIKDFLLGRKVDFGKIDIADNLLKTYGWSEYVASDLRKGNFGSAIGRVILPPYKMWETIYKGLGGPAPDLTEKQRALEEKKIFQYLGTPGKLYYSHALGGAERADAAEAKAEKRKAKKEKSYGL